MKKSVWGREASMNVEWGKWKEGGTLVMMEIVVEFLVLMLMI